jgi:hypothetical protein
VVDGYPIAGHFGALAGTGRIVVFGGSLGLAIGLCDRHLAARNSRRAPQSRWANLDQSTSAWRGTRLGFGLSEFAIEFVLDCEPASAISPLSGDLVLPEHLVALVTPHTKALANLVEVIERAAFAFLAPTLRHLP